MTLTEQIIRKVIKKLLNGDDYRTEIVALIDASFLQFAIEFFKKVINAKLNSRGVTSDWYKDAFLNPEHNDKENIAINAGMNMKTISNMHNSATKQIVIDASNEHYDVLYESIKNLSQAGELDLTLTLKLKDVSVDLTLGETLIVINTLAVKRAALRGSLWSAVGKRVEKPLMQMLCELYGVARDNYKAEHKSTKGGQEDDFVREVDFYLVKGEENYKCEVKLMGKGNPESADAVIARDSKVFVADKLSKTNKSQLDKLGVEWVELRNKDGFTRFKKVLENLDIPHKDINLPIPNKDTETIFRKIFIT